MAVRAAGQERLRRVRKGESCRALKGKVRTMSCNTSSCTQSRTVLFLADASPHLHYSHTEQRSGLSHGQSSSGSSRSCHPGARCCRLRRCTCEPAWTGTAM